MREIKRLLLVTLLLLPAHVPAYACALCLALAPPAASLELIPEAVMSKISVDNQNLQEASSERAGLVLEQV